MFEQGSSNSHKAQFKMPEPAANSARPATPDSQTVLGSSQPGTGLGQGPQTGDDGRGELNIFLQSITIFICNVSLTLTWVKAHKVEIMVEVILTFSCCLCHCLYQTLTH